MRKAWTLLVLSVLIAGTGIFVSSQDAAASFHIMRIYGVMGGASGNANIQYVELRMPDPGQNLLVSGSGGTAVLCFFDVGGVPAARFKFPSDVANGADEASIIIGTAEFDSAWAAGSPDFTFSAANTVALPGGGGELHPVRSPAGKVSFGTDSATVASMMCAAGFSVIDSVAHGTGYGGTVSFGTKLNQDLPTAGIQNAKVQGPAPTNPANGTLCFPGSFFSNCSVARNNSTDYTIVNTNDAGNQPRNNSNQSGPVVILSGDADGDGYTGTAEASIGTDPLGRCGAGADVGPSTDWPSDFVSGGIFDSTDQVDIADLNSFLSPRRLDPVPGDANFSARWDIQPGAGIFGPAWINVADISALLGGTSGNPPMLGFSKAFDGPLCTD